MPPPNRGGIRVESELGVEALGEGRPLQYHMCGMRTWSEPLIQARQTGQRGFNSMDATGHSRGPWTLALGVRGFRWQERCCWLYFNQSSGLTRLSQPHTTGRTQHKAASQTQQVGRSMEGTCGPDALLSWAGSSCRIPGACSSAG